MSAFSKRISTLCLGLLTVLFLSCGGDAQGEIETGTDFSLAVATTQFNLPPGATAATPVAVTWVGCPPRDVTFEFQGLPAGVTPTFTSNPNPTNTQVQLRVDPSLKAGTYDFLLRASSQTLVHTKAMKLLVDPNAPSFTVSITPPTLSMDASRPTTATVNITRTGGYAGSIEVVAKVPAGFTATLTPLTGFLAAATDSKLLTLTCGSVASGTYTVQIQASAQNFLVTQDFSVTVVDAPVITSFTAAPATLELGASSLLQATFSGGSGSISTLGAAASGVGITVTPLITTTYTLTVTNSLGSTATASATVTVGPVVVTITPAAQTLTVGDSVSLTAQVVGAVNKNVTWTAPGGGALTVAGSSASWTSPSTPGTYTVVATSAADPTKTATATFKVVAAPTAQLSATPTLIAPGQSSDLLPVFSGGTAVISPAPVGTPATGVPISTGPLTATTDFTLTVTNEVGRSASASTTVQVQAAPVSTITAPINITQAQAGYTASVPVQTGSTYAWSITNANGTITSATNGPSITFTAGIISTVSTTDLQCVVTNIAGTSTGTFSCAIVPTPQITAFNVAPNVTTNPITALLYGEPLRFDATFSNGTAAIDQGIGAITSGVSLTGSGILARPSGGTTYTLTVTNAAGTTATSTVSTNVQTVTVSIDYPSKPTFNISVNKSTNLDATVTGAYDSSVNWVVLPSAGGSVGPCDGICYFAPGVVGTDLIKAISNADSTVFDSTTAQIYAAPAITAFTRNNAAGTDNIFMSFTGSATGTADLYDHTNPSSPVLLSSTVTSGQTLPFSTIPLPEAYKLVVTNAANDIAEAYVSGISVTVNEGALVIMAGTTATSNPTHTFTATTSGTAAGVNWAVTGGLDPGSIDYSTGVYTPPTRAGSFTVTATANADPNKSDTITVSAYPLFIWPGNQVVGLNHQLILRASILGQTNTNITWSMDPSTPAGAIYGNVDANGVYTSPSAVPPSDPIVVAAFTSNPVIKASVSVAVSTSINAGGKIRGAAGGPGDFTATFGPASYLRYHTLTALANGNALLAGGEDGNAPATPTAYDYSWASNTFSAVTTSMAAVRKWAAATLLHDGSVLVTGGEDASGTKLSSAERFYPYSTGGGYFISTTASMTVARANHTATLLPNGKVLLVGGQGTTGLEASAELYDPATDAFTSAGTLRSPRAYHTATRLLDGRVLVAGGVIDNLALPASLTKEADLFNPVTNSFAATGDLVYPNAYHTMDLTPGGDVLLAGGWYVPVASILSSSEIFKYTSGTWSGGFPSMFGQRFAPMGLMLSDQSFMIFGGSGTANIDFFTTTSNTFDSTVGFPVNTPNWDGDLGRMVMLLSGKVIVAGKNPGSTGFMGYRYPN